MNAAAQMSADEKTMIMMGAAQMTQEVNETIAGMSPAELQKATIYPIKIWELYKSAKWHAGRGTCKDIIC